MLRVTARSSQDLCLSEDRGSGAAPRGERVMKARARQEHRIEAGCGNHTPRKQRSPRVFPDSRQLTASCPPLRPAASQLQEANSRSSLVTAHTLTASSLGNRSRWQCGSAAAIKPTSFSHCFHAVAQRGLGGTPVGCGVHPRTTGSVPAPHPHLNNRFLELGVARDWTSVTSASHNSAGPDKTNLVRLTDDHSLRHAKKSKGRMEGNNSEFASSSS